MVSDGLIGPPGTTNGSMTVEDSARSACWNHTRGKTERTPRLKPASATCANRRGGILLRSRRANQHRWLRRGRSTSRG